MIDPEIHDIQREFMLSLNWGIIRFEKFNRKGYTKDGNILQT
jgi:hypothetical protein